MWTNVPGFLYVSLFFYYCLIGLECKFWYMSSICYCVEFTLWISKFGRENILFLRMACIHDINSTCAFWVIEFQVCYIFPTCCACFELFKMNISILPIFMKSLGQILLRDLPLWDISIMVVLTGAPHSVRLKLFAVALLPWTLTKDDLRIPILGIMDNCEPLCEYWQLSSIIYKTSKCC